MKGNRQECTPNEPVYIELEEMQTMCSDRKQISRLGVRRGERENRSVGWGSRGLREREVTDGEEETLGATDVFTILIAVVVSQVCVLDTHTGTALVV